MILHGFFYFFAFSFIIFIISKIKIKDSYIKIKNILPSDGYILILIIISTLLVILPEIIYVKDIYPDHYRANTMFKLTYQEFIMLQIQQEAQLGKLLL